MLKKLCILFVLASLSLVVSAGTTNKKAQKLYDKAVASVAKGNLEKAEKKLIQSIEKDPKFFEAYLELGRVCQKLGKTTDAENNFEKALAIDAKGAQEVYDILFKVAVEQNDKEKQTKWALAKLETLKNKATDKDAHNVIALAFAKGNTNLKEAQEMFSKVLDAKPDFLEGYLYSGVIYLKNNKKKEAAAIFQRAVDKNLANEDMLNTLSLLYYNDLKDNGKAKIIYNKIIENESSKYRKDALIDMINIEINEKKNPEALALCETFLEGYPTDKLVPAITKRMEKIKHNIEVEKQKASQKK